jgi:hypothetical protein
VRIPGRGGKLPDDPPVTSAGLSSDAGEGQ